MVSLCRIHTRSALLLTSALLSLDVNCGCPIDLVFNKGAGSALLAHATKLGKSLVGMSQVLGEVPLTVKIRTGIANNQPTAHKLMPRFQKEWGVSAVTVGFSGSFWPRMRLILSRFALQMHGRSRQQRYKSFADYKCKFLRYVRSPNLL